MSGGWLGRLRCHLRGCPARYVVAHGNLIEGGVACPRCGTIAWAVYPEPAQILSPDKEKVV